MNPASFFNKKYFILMMEYLYYPKMCLFLFVSMTYMKKTEKIHQW